MPRRTLARPARELGEARSRTLCVGQRKRRTSSDDVQTFFSTSSRTEKNSIHHPRPGRKPHCDSGSSLSARNCRRFWRIRPQSFPTSSSREMPLQLSQMERLPFFGIGTNSASHQSWGTQEDAQITAKRLIRRGCRAGAPYLINSATTPEEPAALPLAKACNAKLSSSMSGGLDKSAHSSRCEM